MTIIRLLRRLPGEDEEDVKHPGQIDKLRKSAMSRRSFLFLGAAAAGGLIVAPTLRQIAQVTLPAGEHGIPALLNDGTIGADYHGIDRILKEYYEPAIVEMVTARPEQSLWEAMDWGMTQPNAFLWGQWEAVDPGIRDPVHGRCPPYYRRPELLTADKRYTRPNPVDDPFVCSRDLP